MGALGGPFEPTGLEVPTLMNGTGRDNDKHDNHANAYNGHMQQHPQGARAAAMEKQ